MGKIVVAQNLNAFVGTQQQGLWVKLLNQMELVQIGRLISNVKNKTLMKKLAIADGVRPYRMQEDLNDNDLNYSGTVLEVEQWKRDISVDPYEFLKTPMAEDQADKKSIPQAQIVNEAIIARVAKELNATSWNGRGVAAYAAYTGATVNAGSRVVFNGNYYLCITNAGANESPSTHPAKYRIENNLAVCKGLGVFLAEEIAASRVVPYSTGSLTNSNTLTKIQEMWDTVEEAYKNEPMIALVSHATHSKYKKEYRSQITNNDGMREIPMLVPDTNEKLTIVPFSGMSGSNRVIVTPASNLITGTDLESDFNNIVWKDTELHRLKATVKGLLGFTFHDMDPGFFIVNDQA